MQDHRRSGWLSTREVGEREFKNRWCVLDNGVLWLYSRPGEQDGRAAMPLQDAVVGDCEPPAPLHLAVRCRRSGRLLALGAPSREDYLAWMEALTAAAREWRDKRRASVLNKQLMALAAEKDDGNTEENQLGNKELEELKFTPRRRSEVPPPRLAVRPVSLTATRRLPLREVVLSAKPPEQLRWQRLPEVLESGLLGLLSEEQVALEELKFAALVEEFRFSTELSALLRLATRAVSWQDPQLPVFHRRSIVSSITKVKRSSDHVLRVAERHWSQRVTLQSSIFSLLGAEARAAGWSAAYTEYCTHLAELRDCLARASLERADVRVSSQSSRYGLELALVPVQHLTTLRQLMQTLFEIMPPGASEQPAARASRDFLNQILDSCYEELTEQSGSEYVAEMDNLLQFDLSSVTAAAPGPQLLYTRRKPRAPPIPTINGSEIISEEEGKKLSSKVSKSKSRPSLFHGQAIRSAAQYVRRKTAEGLGLRSRTASLPALNLTLEMPKIDPHTYEPSSDEEEEEEGVENSSQVENPVAMPRYFCNEPLYQSYCLAVSQELTERAMPRRSSEEAVPPAKLSTTPSGCSRWADHPRVVDTGLLGELSTEQVSLAEAKFELAASEAAFLRSLRVLEAHFAHCPELYDEEVLPPADRHSLFAAIEPQRVFCERVLGSLERCWEEDVLLDSLCRALHPHLTSAAARVAATACFNHTLAPLALHRLSQQPKFSAALKRLERGAICEGFSLLTFVTLPLRRLGRLRLLLEHVARLMGRMPNTKLEERIACESSRDAVCRLISRAEAAARRAHSDAMLQALAQHLSFRRVPRLAVSAEGRALVHRGSWQVLGRREEGRGAMRAKNPYVEMQAILLSDLLLLVMQDGYGGAVATDYSSRAELQLREAGPGCDEPLPGYLERDEVARHALYVSFRGHSNKLVEMIINCGGMTERARWLTAAVPPDDTMAPPSPAPRQPALARALHPHVPQLPDEGRLTQGDVIAVLKSPGDGWLLARSLVDGAQGWIPSVLTMQLCAGRKSVTFLVEPDAPRFSIA